MGLVTVQVYSGDTNGVLSVLEAEYGDLIDKLIRERSLYGLLNSKRVSEFEKDRTHGFARELIRAGKLAKIPGAAL